MTGSGSVSATMRRMVASPVTRVLVAALAAGIAMALVQHAVQDQLLLDWPSEESYLDHLFRTRSERAGKEEEVLLVHFDDETFRTLNTPFSKFGPHLIRLVELLRSGEPKVIGVDMGFAYLQQEASAEAFLAGCQRRDDVVFTSEIRSGKPVPVLSEPVVAMVRRANPPLGFANLADANNALTADVNRGRIFRLAMLQAPAEEGRAHLWSFPLEVALRARKLSPAQVQVTDREVFFGERRVPLEQGMLRIDYRGAKYFTSVPVENFLTGKVPPRIARGRVVMVGADYQALGDYHLTPYGTQNGLRIQAAVVHTLLAGQPLRKLPAGFGRGLCVLMALAVGAAFARWGRMPALACALVLGGALHALNLAAFQQGYWTVSFFPVLCAPVTGLLLWGLDFRRSEVRFGGVVRAGSGVRSVPGAPLDPTMPAGPASLPADGGDMILRIAREVVSAKYGDAQLLGRGGMGVVLRAYDTERQQYVAVKILSPLLTDRPQLVARFMREIKALQQLTHPGVVRILDVGEGGSNPYYSMELVDGVDLRSAMRDGPFELARVRDVFGQLIEVLGHIHDHGVIHRDVKPDNVLLSDGDRVKLLDFGLAHVPEASTLTQDGEVMGTLRYMSPEQMDGQDLTPASDVFAVGLVIFEALTGKMPFPEIGRVLHHTGTITSVDVLRPDVPRAVAALLMKCTHPAATMRPASCSVMAKAWSEAWSEPIASSMG